MTRHNYNYLLAVLALPVNRLSKQYNSFTRRFFSTVRAFGMALIVIATLLSAADASALSRTKVTEYGTLSYVIEPLEGNKYNPGQRYAIDVMFKANSKVFDIEGGWDSYVIVKAGSRTLFSKKVFIKKNKTTSVTGLFTAPTDGSPLKIFFGDGVFGKEGNEVFESITIYPMEVEEEAQEDQEDTSTDEDISDDGTGDEMDDGSDSESNEDIESEDDETDANNTDEENPAEENSFLDEMLSNLTENELIQVVQNWFAGDPLGIGKQATPPEAVGIGSVAALISLLLGGVGAVGGGTGGALGGLAGGAGGGALPPPIEGAPSGPAPIQDPFQRIEEKYVTRDPDGSITIKDPITGEPKLYLPDGQGGYDNPLGGGFKSEEDMLNHLAYLDRNSGTLSQDAATAAFNQAQQREQWDTQNARDLARGYSDEMADYKQWKDEEERKTNQIIKLADKYCVAADEESVRKAVKAEMIKAGIESAKQEAEAARNDMIVVGLESTKNVAATSLVMIPLALSGVGTVSATTMAKVKIWQSVYTMSTSVIDKVGDAYVKGENTGTAAVHGLVTGTVGVIQNYAGNMGGLKTEAAIVIGGEGFKAGYEEYTSSGDLNKTLDKTIEGIKTGTVNHAINKTLDFGINKAKGWASSSKANVNKANVESTRAQADATGKTVTTRQQALTQAQNKVTTAKGNVTKAQQNVTRSQQQVANAQGKVNTANKQLSDANKKVDAALKQLKQASKPADVSKAQADLKTAQQGAAQAQQNVNRANSELKSAQQKDYAAKRVAMNAENNLQKAQMGAQKAQSDLKAANAQHEQALRGAYAAEQQAQIDKFNNSISAPASGSDIGNVKDFLEKEGYISKDDK